MPPPDMPPAQPGGRELEVFLVAVEPSADRLGASLMTALKARHGAVSFRGLGGPSMLEAGLASAGDIRDLSGIGISTVVAKLPAILRRLRETVDAIAARAPDVLILIDAPDFTHRVAARVRKRLPGLPIVKYVSPTVWIWRPGRARAMRGAIDLVLALLPFEPEVHRQLGGPPCVYVGHPLLENRNALVPSAAEAGARAAEPPLVLALPGSRPHEIQRLGAIFGETLGILARRRGTLDVVLPTVPQLSATVCELTAAWPVRPRLVTEEADKFAAFRRARAALAASGTVTLELALAGIPCVAAYRIPALEGLILRLIARVHPAVGIRSVILANLVLRERVIPEFLQGRCTAQNLAPALAELVDDTPARRRQIEAFKRIEPILGTGSGQPSDRAAQAVLDFLAQRSISP